MATSELVPHETLLVEDDAVVLVLCRVSAPAASSAGEANLPDTHGFKEEEEAGEADVVVETFGTIWASEIGALPLPQG